MSDDTRDPVGHPPRPEYRPRKAARSPAVAATRRQWAIRKAAQVQAHRTPIVDSLDDLCPLVLATLKSLRAGRERTPEGLRRSRVGTLDMEVAEGSIDRACCIAESLVRAAKGRGITVRAGGRGKPPGSWFAIANQRVMFWIREEVDREEVSVGRQARKGIDDWLIPGRAEYRHSPTGRLRVRIEGTGQRRSTWADTRRWRLEDAIESVIESVLAEPAARAEAERVAAERKADEERRRRAREQQEAERRAVLLAAEADVKTAAQLRRAAHRWQEAQLFRAFAHELERLDPGSPTMTARGMAGPSIEWIRSYADRVDPFCVEAGEPPEFLLGLDPWSAESLAPRRFGWVEGRSPLPGS